MSQGGPPVGIVLGSALPPENIKEIAVDAEKLGFCELWLAEDYFFTGGISGAAAVLEATDSIPVGLGIVSAMVRHPAVLAMELSTMARMYPGRLLPGIGLGVPHWMAQMDLNPKSSLTALRECVGSLRRLLAGEELTEQGRYFSFDKVKLTYPLEGEQQVPLYMGVLGPKMLNLSGEIADGTVVSVLAGTDYVRWARERTLEGAAQAGRDYDHKLATFVLFACDEDGQKAKDDIRPALAFYLATVGETALTRAYGIDGELTELAKDGPEALAAKMPDQWLEDLVVAGSPDECADKINALLDAGSASVDLFCVPTEKAPELLRLAADKILPKVKTPGRLMEESYIDGPAGRLRIWTHGPADSDRLPILFVHPINTQGGAWDGVARRLPDRRSVMPDMRGHGNSDPGGPYGLAEWTSDLLAALDDQGIERAHVVGGSLGGPLSVYLAATHPDRVASIVAIGAALHIEGEDVSAVLEVLREKGVKGMFREVIPEISVAPGTDPDVIEQILELANPNDAETVAAIWGATISSDATPQAPNVRCPALVLTGEHDKTCTPEQGEELARALGLELEILPGVGHLPMNEAPGLLADRLSAWLATQER